MCTRIGTNYGTVLNHFSFIFGTLMGQHVLHIVLNFQVNIFNSSGVINIYVFLPLGWAGQPTMNVAEVAISWDRPDSMWR